MRYPGGKGKTYQHIINLMPPHQVYIETHLGGGAVIRHKKPAARNFAIEVDERPLQSWTGAPGLEVELVHGRAEDFLAAYSFTGQELVYVDAPYLPETRRRERVYRHDYDADAHRELLELIRTLPCMVLVSGYSNALYDEFLTDWNKRTYNAKTHVDVREETLWFNYTAPTLLHDSRYLGHTFRHRQTFKRRLERLKRKFECMDPVERSALIEWLDEQYAVKEETR